MRLLLLLIFFSTLQGTTALGQQDPEFGHYRLHMLPVNPAYAGTKKHISTNLLIRKQWLGAAKEGPSLQSLAVHTPLNYNRFGAGLILNNEKTGSTQATEIQTSWSYKIHFFKGFLAMGLSFGGKRFSTSMGNLNVRDPNDPHFNKSRETAWAPDIGTGLFWYGKNHFVSLSARHINNPVIGFDKTIRNLSIKPEYYLRSSYEFNLSSRADFQPVLAMDYIRPDQVKTSIMNIFKTQEIGWAGLGYTSAKEINIQCGLYLNKVIKEVVRPCKISYLYQQGHGRTNDFPSDTHEIMLSYMFDIEPSPEKIEDKEEISSPIYF